MHILILSSLRLCLLSYITPGSTTEISTAVVKKEKEEKKEEEKSWSCDCFHVVKLQLLASPCNIIRGRDVPLPLVLNRRSLLCHGCSGAGAGGTGASGGQPG